MRRADGSTFLGRKQIVNRWSALIVLACFISSPLVPAPPEEIRIGSLGARGTSFTEELPGTFSEVVSGAGDVNGDGKDDFLLLHHDRARDYEPTVFLVTGRDDLPASIPAVDLGSFSTTFRMAGPRYRGADIIRGMAPVDDLDGDTFDDFFIFRPYGSTREEVYMEGDPTPGVAYLVHGSPSLPREVLLDSPVGSRITVFTSSGSKHSAIALSAATGDLNGDGKLDLALGAGFSDLEEVDTDYPPGRLFVLLGGEAFEGTVDVEEAGSGRPGFILEGHADGAALGRAVIFPGDVNGDGFEDLAVGSSSLYGSDPSWAYIVFGAAEHPPFLSVADLVAGLGVRFTGNGSATNTGETLAAPGDVNADGFADILIAASGASLQKGEVYLVHGRAELPSDIAVADIPDLGLGVTFRAVKGDVFGGERAGASVAVLDALGDGTSDFVIGAPGAAFRGIPNVGKVFIVEGRSFEPGIVSLGGIEEGTLAGAVITTEVSLTNGVAAKPHLGAGAAAVGDVDGDGLGDLIVAEPSRFTVTQAGRVHLIRGASSAGPLVLERAEPGTVAMDGGSELTLIGSELDASVEVRIGGAVAAVKRAITTARLVVEAPQLGSTGPMDVTVTRGGEMATLAGGVVYVPYLHPGIDLLELGTTHPGVIVQGPVRNFGESIAMLDLDADGLSDIVAESGLGLLAVLYGSTSLEGVLDLGDLGTGDVPEGVSLVRTTSDLFIDEAGDLNADGRDDLAVSQQGLVTILFAEKRLPPETDLRSLVLEGRGVDVLSAAPILAAAGGGDLDGDGLEDLAITVDGAQSGSVFLLAGRRSWPSEVFMEDSARFITSTVPEDRFGSTLAVLGDVNGDGLDDLLAGAPGQYWRDDGNGHVIFGGAWPLADAETVQRLLAQGEAARVDAFKPKDSIGSDVCGTGDFDGDGIPDLALSSDGGGVYFHGETYVVFGSSFSTEPGQPGAIVSTASLGERGVRILGGEPYDNEVRLAPAGDFDGDGLRDLLIGASSGAMPQGEAFVIFGGAARTVQLSDLGTDGVRMTAAGAKFLGWSVAGGGDFNGDGLGDVVLADAPLPPLLGSLYIVFGQGPLDFIRGDSNGDAKVELSDPVRLLGHLFLGTEPPPCLDAADGNDSGALDITDAIFVLEHLFLGGSAPPPPYPDPGFDITPDDLRCGRTP